MKRNTFKLPNQLVLNVNLDFTTRKVGAVLYGRRNAFGFCTKSLESLATLSHCSVSTVRKAVKQLSDAGYVHFSRSYRYLPRKGRMVYGPMAYQVDLSFDGGYTLIPRDIFEEAINSELTASSVVIMLSMLVAAGNQRRAWPSISRIERMVGAVRSTVCRALRQIKSMLGILVLLCRKRNGSYAASSYHFTTVLTEGQAAAFKQEPDFQQGAVQRSHKGCGILHAIILPLVGRLRKLFFGKKVVRFLANYS